MSKQAVAARQPVAQETSPSVAEIGPDIRFPAVESTAEIREELAAHLPPPPERLGAARGLEYAYIPEVEAVIKDAVERITINRVYNDRRPNDPPNAFVLFWREHEGGGLYIADWRPLNAFFSKDQRPEEDKPELPIHGNVHDGYVLIWYDVKDGAMREVRSKTYDKLDSNFDLEVAEKERFPVTERRPLTLAPLRRPNPRLRW